MLRNVVVHITNEQPIMVDLVSEPTPSDLVLICCNVRTMNGKKPVFIDRSDSTFVMPLSNVRFVEMPLSSMEAHEAEKATQAAEAGAVDSDAEYETRPLARLAWLTGDAGEPVQASGEESGAGASA